MNETSVRHTNRFLADLMATMRSAAETARKETLEQCRTDVDEYARVLKVRTSEAAETMRASANTDIEAIREWSRAEMERIRLEAETRIAGRGEELERDLANYESAVDAEIEHANERVRVFEDEVAVFCERLLGESDPATFASLAGQMPEPPAFDPDEALAALAGGAPAAAEEEEPAVEAEPEAAEQAAEEATAETAPEAAAEEPTPDATAEEASAGEEATPDAAEEPVFEAEANPAAEAEPAAADEPETAAADEAVDDIPTELSAIPELDEPALDARLAGLRSMPRTSNGESTRVVVVGLVSVASIATFKRQLSRLPGVRSVGVSSGPDGEFVFTAAHSTETSLGSLITSLPGFQARVVSQQDGVLNISARDPEAEG